MTATAWLAIYCVLILLASLAGGWIPLLVRLTHKWMEVAVSFVAGVMLGVGLLHMLPHAFEARAGVAAAAHAHAHSEHEHAHALIEPLMLWLLAGFMVMFIIERFFCFHHHEAPDSEGSHVHAHEHAHHELVHSRHSLSWTGAAIGLSIHSLIEGVALAASVEAGRGRHDGGSALAALGTFMVIFLHKPFDSLTLGTLMNVGGRSARLRHVVNIAFSLLIPAGAALFYMGLAGGDGNALLVSSALAFSAGTFLCIAMSDLLPELQFHQHDRVKLSAALLAGLGLAWLISALERGLHH